MSQQDEQKKKSALAAAELVESGMVVGLGTGSTATYLIDELGRRRREEGLDIVGIPTSEATARRAVAAGVPLSTLDGHPSIELTIDGADEVDPQFRLIKGHGGALLREKIVAAASRRMVVVVDESKLVERLGNHLAIPVEVIPFGCRAVVQRIENLDATAHLRVVAETDQPLVTDSGNWILDCQFGAIADPAELEARLNNMPGVVENGLFIDLADDIFVGSTHDVRKRSRTP